MSAPASTAVGPLSDLTVGEGRAYVVDGSQVAVFRMSDGLSLIHI